MNDPHVELLIYTAAPSKENISYKDPPPIAFDNGLGHFELTEGELTIAPTDHFPDIQSARDAVADFLRAWEIRTDLDGNPGMIRFTYKNAKVIDRDPPPPGSGRIVTAVGACAVSMAGTVSANVSIGKSTYPDPPTAFKVSADVETAHIRWIRYKEGKDSLLSASYFILTLIKAAGGGLKPAAKKYDIPFSTLKRIGELSSTRGTAETARKAGYSELSGEESSWLEKAVRDVIIQLGLH